MGLYNIALGSGFVVALLWSIVLSLRRNTLRKQSEQHVRRIIGRIQGMENNPSEHSDHLAPR
jgi:hypothetical protein